MRPIRLLHLIATSGRGGAESVVADLSTRFDRSQVESEVGLSEAGWLSDRLQDAGVALHWLRRSRVVDYGLLRSIVGLIRARMPDVVHCHLGAMGLYGCLAAWWTRTPAIAHVHGLPHDLDRPRRRWVQRQAWRAASRVVVVSDCLRRTLCQMGAPAAKMVVIPNGVQLDAFLPQKGNGDLKRALGIAETKRVVAVVSRLEPEKGVELALDCFTRICRQTASVVLVIAGDGSQRRGLEQKAGQSGLNRSVRFLGHVDDVSPLLGASDVVLIPARFEGFSLAAVEAMAASRPVIAWDHQGPQEIVVDRETGRLVPPFDVGAMADATVDLLSDPGQATAMGRAGRARAEGCYSLDRMAKEFERLYASLRQEGGGAR